MPRPRRIAPGRGGGGCCGSLVPWSAAANTASVILIEDMHWIDEASEEFVAALVQAVASTKTMLLLNYRSSYRSPWAGLEHFQEIEVAELTAADTDALVHELMSHQREFKDISQLIARRSGGNPFFAEELVRSLAERGVLSGDPDHAKNGVDSVELARCQRQSRLSLGRGSTAWSSPKNRCFEICAIVGKEIPLAVLERVVGTARGDIERSLDSLCYAELILPQPTARGRRFAFRHPLIQEVAYGTQLKAKRVSIHASVAGALEHYYADQLDEFAALISHHYEAAGRCLSAAEYSRRAAHWLGSTDSAQAIKHWHKVRTPGAIRPGTCRATAAGDGVQPDCPAGMARRPDLEDVQPFIDEAMELASKVDDRLTQLLLMIEGRMLQASGGPADCYVEKARQAFAGQA